jgi:hypothetical protein
MWSKGTIAIPDAGKHEYWVKHYDCASDYGINGGKVSKMVIRKAGESRDLYSYDRGLDVDCFAGKGKFEDGKDGSPRIALDARHNCLTHTSAQAAQIETCFIDLNYANELSGNITDFHSDGISTVIHGKYEEEIDGLLANKRNYNVFSTTEQKSNVRLSLKDKGISIKTL